MEFGLDVVCGFHQLQRLGIATHHQVAEVVGPTGDEMVGVKSARHDVVEEQHGPGDVTGKSLVRQREIRVVVEHVKLLRHRLVGEVLSCESHELVKH